MEKQQEVKFTRHALFRAFDLGLPSRDEKEMVKLFLQAVPQPYNIKRELYKLDKYRDNQEGISYWETKGLIFTVKEVEDTQIVLTITGKSRKNRKRQTTEKAIKRIYA
jgi:hypothetical protein